MNPSHKNVFVAVGAVVLLSAVVIGIWSKNATVPSEVPAPADVTSEPVAPAPSPSPVSQPPTAQNPAPTPGTPPPAPIPAGAVPPGKVAVIAVWSPKSNEQWVIGTPHTIQWSGEAGIKGSISLIDATTNSVVGLISSETGPHQTSYAWDTKSVYLTRYGGLKKDIGIGKYMIQVTFDGNVKVATSPQFLIVIVENKEIATQSVSIQNYTYSPASITVHQGDIVKFTNFDSVTHRVIAPNFFGPVTIAAGATESFDTSILKPGSYQYYCDYHGSMKPATLIVQ